MSKYNNIAARKFVPHIYTVIATVRNRAWRSSLAYLKVPTSLKRATPVDIFHVVKLLNT